MKKKDRPKPDALGSSQKVIAVCVSLIALLGGTVYFNSIGGQFIWDDQHLIVNNPWIKDWSYLPRIFSGSIAAGPGIDYPFYRPLLMLTLMTDYALFGLNVEGYHMMTIAMHILAAITLFFFIKNHLANYVVALASALLFVAHPIHTENVAYITGRAEPLILIFLLLSFTQYLKFTKAEDTCALFLCPAGFLAALLIKENSVILPALVVLYHFVFRKKINLKIFLPIALMAVMYVYLRLFVYRAALSDVSAAGSLEMRIPGFFVALANYTRLMFMPFDLHMEYGSKLFSMAHPKAAAGAVIFVFLVAVFFRYLRSKPLYAFSIGWFFIALLPVANVVYPASDYMAERYMYLPSLGFFLSIAQVTVNIYDAKKYRIISVAAAISLLVFYAVLTVRQNGYWSDALTFYKRTMRYAPDSAAIYNNLGSEYRKRGFIDEAVKMYRESIRIAPGDPKGYNNLGISLTEAGRYREAEEAFRQSVSADPGFANGYYNQSLLYFRTQRYDLALSFLRQAVARGHKADPEYERQLKSANSPR